MVKLKSSSGGIGFFGAMAIVFISAKLLGKIDWSWMWVLSPLWLPVTCLALLFMAVFVVAYVCALLGRLPGQGR